MFVRLLALGIFTATPYLAAASEGYWDAQKLPRSIRPRGFERALEAFVGVNHASGTFISNSGHILMSAHQLARILHEQQGLATGRSIDPVDLGRGFFVYQVSSRIVEGARIFVTLSNDLVGVFGEVSAEVVYIGRAFNPWVETKRAVLDNLFEFFSETKKGAPIQIEDFAVLKIDLGVKTPCIKISANRPKLGQRIWAIGKPVSYHLSNLRNGKSWDASDQDDLGLGVDRTWVSVGRVVDPTAESPIEGETDHMLSEDPSLYFNNDAEGIWGFSGGPIVDENSMLIGTASSLVNAPEYLTSVERPQSPERDSNWPNLTGFEKWRGIRAVATASIQALAVQDFSMRASGEIPWAHCD